MIATADLRKLHHIHQERARVAVAHLARCSARLEACQRHLSALEIQLANAEAKFRSDTVKQISESRTAAHLKALPAVMSLLKLRHHDNALLLDHQIDLAREELEERQEEHAKRQQAVFAANAKVEKFASLLEQTTRQEDRRADDRADDQAAEEHAAREQSYAT